MPRVAAKKPETFPPVSVETKERVHLQGLFGERLRLIRHEKLLTIEQVAELAGLHPNYVGSVERGERNVSLFNIWRIAGAMGLKGSDLLDELPVRKVKRISLKEVAAW